MLTDPVSTGLHALAWILADRTRAERMIELTGLDPEDLRQRASEPAVLCAILSFLEAHEPDLLACARDLDIEPESIVAARRELEA